MKTKILFLFIGCFLFFAGCKVDPPISHAALSLEEFHQKYGPASQTFSFNGETGSTLVTASGVEIVIPDSAFRDYDGNVIKGELQLVVKEVFRKSDMVFAGMHTMSYGPNGLLESAGMFHLELRQNGQKVYPYSNTSERLTISIPASSIDTNMQLFTALPGIDPSLPSSGYSPVVSAWYLIYSDSLGSGGYINYDTIAPRKYILSTGLGFINCDRFINDPNPTKIVVKVDEPFSPYDIAVYIAFNELNSVANLYHDYGDSTLPLTFTSPNIPISTPVTVIVFGIKDGLEYLGVEDIIVSANQVVNIEVKEATKAQILDEMEKLNE